MELQLEEKNTVSFDDSSDFEQSPAKMFVGLFVLFGLMVGGFSIVHLVARPEVSPPQSETNRPEFPLPGVTSPRAPDGSLMDDPIGQGLGDDWSDESDILNQQRFDRKPPGSSMR